MEKALLFLLVLAITASACNHDAPFEGTWAGTYSGNDTGTWQIVIDADGALNGIAYSNIIQSNMAITGIVSNNGDLSATSTTSTGAQFVGTLTDNTGSGTWTNQFGTFTFSGTWVGTKQ